MTYRRRTFTIGTQDALSIFVKRVMKDGVPYVILREDSTSPFRGMLRSHFEGIATLYTIELIMLGLAEHLPQLRFVFEKPAWSNGKVSFKAEWSEVRMPHSGRGYGLGYWSPLDAKTVEWLSGQPSCLTA